MSAIIVGEQLRTLLYGTKASKAVANTVGTKSLFTITGGKVLVTSIIGEVTTTITVAGTTAIQANPTVGTTGVLALATDLGTVDTLQGNLLGITGLPADAIFTSVGSARVGAPIAVSAGVIEQVTATGGDGAITWTVTWIPLDDGASLAAA